MRKGRQPPWIVPDGLWERIEPLLPKRTRRFRHPGRKPLDDRKALSGILFVLHTGIPWEFLPQELGFGSGMTCWRRLHDWNEAGVWQRLHELLLAELQGADPANWRPCVTCGASTRPSWARSVRHAFDLRPGYPRPRPCAQRVTSRHARPSSPHDCRAPPN
jgi:transposase